MPPKVTIKTKQAKKNLTIAEQGYHLKESMRDPVHFIKNFVKIRTPKSVHSIPFKLWPFQEECLKDFMNPKNRYNIVLKSRQLGISTLIAAYSFWRILFRKNQNIVIIATKQDVARNLFMKIEDMYTILKSDKQKNFILFHEEKEKTKFSLSLRFPTGEISSVKCIPRSDSALRSESPNLVIFDEAAFIDNFETIWTSAQPAIDTGGHTILLSSPNGAKGKFYEIWSKSKAVDEKRRTFNCIELPWNVHPERDEQWKESAIAAMLHDKDKFAQEYECAFLDMLDDSYFSADILKNLKNNKIKPPIRKDREDDRIWIWKDKQEGHKYIISADISKGVNKDRDNSVFHILDIDTGLVCAEFVGQIQPDDLAVLLVKWAEKYNFAFLCPEANTFGSETLAKIYELGYKKVYHSKKNFRMYGTPLIGKKEDYRNGGVQTQSTNRDMMLASLATNLKMGFLKIQSSRFMEEAESFIIGKTGKPKAANGYHDDTVLCLAIANFMFETYGNPSECGGDYSGGETWNPEKLKILFQKRGSKLEDLANNKSIMEKMSANKLATDDIVERNKEYIYLDNIDPKKIKDEEMSKEIEEKKAALRKRRMQKYANMKLGNGYIRGEEYVTMMNWLLK